MMSLNHVNRGNLRWKLKDIFFPFIHIFVMYKFYILFSWLLVFLRLFILWNIRWLQLAHTFYWVVHDPGSSDTDVCFPLGLLFLILFSNLTWNGILWESCQLMYNLYHNIFRSPFGINLLLVIPSLYSFLSTNCFRNCGIIR